MIRTRLIGQLAAVGTSARLVCIEGGPGYGKSVLAAQAIDAMDAESIWYQLSQEDQDPITFLTTLYSSCRQKIPDYNCTVLQSLLEKGDVAANDLATPARLLVNGLSDALQGTLYVVLDDLHELTNQPWSAELVRVLLESACESVRFITTSRQPLDAIIATDLKFNGRLTVTGEQLQFSIDEVVDLYQDVFGICITAQQAAEIHGDTSGWAVGVAMHRLKPGSAGSRNVGDYLKRVVLDPLSRDDQQFLTEVSLLSEISNEELDALVSAEDGRGRLHQLSKGNAFIRRHKGVDITHSLHPLLREYLQENAGDILGATQWQAFNQRAAEHYRNNGNSIRAIRLYLILRDYQNAATLLAENGLDLYSRGQYVTLQKVLADFPVPVVENSSWLSLLAGAVYLELQPARAYPYLAKAKNLFAESADAVGELLVLSLIIFYRGSITATYEMARPDFEQALSLYEEIGQGLPSQIQLYVCSALGAAYQFLDGDFEQARKYVDIAHHIATQYGLENRIVRLQYFRFHALLASGRHSQAQYEAEVLHDFERKPGVDRINRGLILCAKLNLLYISGLTQTYRDELHNSPLNQQGEILKDSIIGPYLHRWDGDLYLSKGDYTAAFTVASAGMQSSGAGASEHMRSQFLQIQAASLALTGKNAQARECASESFALRTRAGEKNQATYNHLSLGVTYLVLGEWDDAEYHFSQALQKSLALEKTYVQASANFYWALLHLRRGDENACKRELKKFAELMKASGLDYFYFWIPELAEEIICFAVENGCDPELMRHLAAVNLDKGVSEKGALFPLLRIHVQGGMSFRLEGNTVLKGEALTQTQREFLALLVCQPDLQLSQAEIQQVLWRNIPSDKARARLDTLLRRLRSSLKDIFSPWDVGHYLSLKKGLISLKNCQVDAQDFKRDALEGMKLLQSGRHWMAGLKLSSACNTYKGKFLPGINGFYSVTDLRGELQDIYLSVCLDLSRLHKGEGDTRRATELLVTALRNVPWDENLSKELFQLYIAQGAHRKAKKLLQNFENRMQEEGFSADEIEDALWEIRSA